ncbi:MAG: lamin tail domain-containing protein [Planctomycetota bacterium]|nr:lamin tail domain-containing protein [Planctomycetota bacterium]
MKIPRRFLAGALVALASTTAPRAGPVVINEIHHAPSERTVPEEFVELYNNSDQPVDVGGWFFSQGIDFRFPPGTVIGPRDYLVVAQDPGVLVGIYGNVPVVGPFTGRLDNDGERVVLRNRFGGREDQVDYGRGFPWPTVGGPAGHSMSLVNPDLDNDLGGSWRASSPGSADSSTLIPAGGSWRYLKGTAEASAPAGAWREAGFDDSGWSVGRTSIGYGEGFIRTELADMRGNYSSVFLRKTFELTSLEAIGSLVLEAQFDDGFNAWINGVHVASSNVAGAEMAYNSTARRAIENLDFQTFSLLRPQDVLVQGTNSLAIQLHNASLGGSSDAFLDARLLRSSGGGSGPTPGGPNSVFSDNVPPHLRQVNHAPSRPTSNELVLVTVKATDPDGVASVDLEYQIVEPGSYIEVDDPQYLTAWTPLEMNDAGVNGDRMADDDIYSVLLPRTVQRHRRLVRYRISAIDGAGLSLRVPYADDPEPNFAYFVYDGVPAWSGAIQPGSSNTTRRRVVEYSSEIMSSVPVYHLITKRASTEDCTWFSRYGGSDYRWRGTLVYDGEVYDHVRYRARGGVWRYSMGKNMWKFDFLRGHSFQARDDFGRKYATEWDKLNFSAIIQQGNFLHRGEQGLFESAGFKLFNLVGVESPKTHFVTFRIIDEADEFGANQYGGDFWGLYLVLEQMDGRFLDEHALPDGNLYKMEGGTGDLNNQGPTGATDKSDLNAFIGAYRTTQSDQWWREHLDLDRYYSYRSVVEGIHHYDIAGGKNYFYYLDPETDIWSVLPWDLDLAWADNMYGSGDEPFRSRVLSRSSFNRGYQRRIREIRDLLFNPDQTNSMIDELAAVVDDPAGGPSLVDADRAKWDYNPVMVNSSIVNLSKAGHGRYYERSPTRDFPGMARLMKNYVVSRGSRIDSSIARDSSIPRRPSVQSVSPPGFPVDQLRFRASDFSDPQGNGTFGSMKWRIAEITPPGAPPFDPRSPRLFEIDAAWESEELTSFRSEITIPPGAVNVGGVYRVRVRMTDNTGRTSQWSAPRQFTAGEPTVPFPQQRYLRVTEIMYNPLDGSDREFIEIQNIGADSLDLRPVSLTNGVQFRFDEGDVPSLAPGEFVLVVKNRAVFEASHDTTGMNIAGEYTGRLSDGGERVTLTFGGNLTILDFAYDDAWYPLTDGGGPSLVVVDPLEVPLAWRDRGNWRESDDPGGSPGSDEGSGPPPGGFQRPVDANQDGLLDLSDAVALLLHLFGGGRIVLPCDGGSAAEGGNLLLLDANADGAVDISDAVHVLGYLFQDGPPPAQGSRCRRIEGCPRACSF